MLPGVYTATGPLWGRPRAGTSRSRAARWRPTLGTVRLSGLATANGGASFGFKFRSAGGSVRTKTADAADGNGRPTDPELLFNTNLVPTTGPHAALAGDFYSMDV